MRKIFKFVAVTLLVVTLSVIPAILLQPLRIVAVSRDKDKNISDDFVFWEYKVNDNVDRIVNIKDHENTYIQIITSNTEYYFKRGVGEQEFTEISKQDFISYRDK